MKGFFNKEFWIKITRLSVSLILTLLGTFVFSEAKYGLAVNLSIMIVAYLIVAYDILWEALEGLFKGKNPFNEDFLMSIASIGAFCLRFFGEGNNEFFEAVLVVFLFQVGELFEDIATYKSHKAIKDAVGLRAKYANLIEGDVINKVEPESVKIGDSLLIKVGEIIPLDGEIIKGEGYLDMSSLTGESVPVHKALGDQIPSGTILKNGSLTIKVNKTYQDSTVSKILRLIEDSSASKSKADKFVDRFSKVYTPIVCLLAILTATIPPLFLGINNGVVWEKWLYTSLSFLIISCPCSIVISVPLAFFAGIGLSSKNGLVIKGALIIDKLNDLGLVVSDKTGTLTYGNFGVTKKEIVNVDSSLFNECLLAGESQSNHPIAKAIVGEHDLKDISKNITKYTEEAGYGVICEYKKHRVLVGNDKLLNKYKIPFTPSLEVGTVVYLAIDKDYAGYVVCADTIRKESLTLIEGLHQRGIKSCMLSGDKEKNVLAVATTLGIDEAESELLPEEKTKILKSKLVPNRKMVAYIGDGINDAPSIALADIGIAMGGVGSDLAIDSADVVIMNDNPAKLITALNIAKETKRRVIFNIVVSLVVKVAVMVCAAFVPGFPLYAAVMADTGLTVLLIINSLMLLTRKRV
jgi:Cd2+/Zn2+-exporting ATPase